jgi:hypothetical protein
VDGNLQLKTKTCDRTTGHPNSVNTTDVYRVSFLFYCFHYSSTFCMLAAGRCPSLLQGMHGLNAWVGKFVCLCEQELRRVMDGGVSNCTEERFA